MSDWSTAQIALILSAVSLLISLAGFVWNIWSKFIYPKGRLRLIYQKMNPEHGRLGETYWLVEAVNEGPVDLIVRFPALPTKKQGFLDKSIRYYSLESKSPSPTGGSEIRSGTVWPRRVKVGETMHVIVSSEMLKKSLSKKPIGLGYMDTYGRFHLLPSQGFAKLIRKVTE